MTGLFELQALICLVLVGIAVFFFLRRYLKFQHHNQIPRGFSESKFIPRSALPRHVSAINDVYATRKVPEDIDCIIIGSGIGGLACAGLLSRAGQRCLVLEQHYIAGGATHAFEEHGYEFDTGIHYIGNIEKRRKYLDLITDTPLEWDKMGRLSADNDGDECYDELEIGQGADTISLRLKAGKEKFIAEMCKKFPTAAHRAAVEEYVRLCTDCASKDLFFDLKIANPVWLGKLLNKLSGQSAKFFGMVKKTALEVVCELTPDMGLQAALLAQFGDYGQTPSTESFFMHASVANHYMSGGWYPRGGSTVLARGIVPVIERSGGRVLVGARSGSRGVEQILVENGRAVGVRMANGDVIKANKAVISACGVFNTYKKLLLPKAPGLPPSVEAHLSRCREKMDRIGHSCSFVYLFVGMDGSPASHKLRSSNIWVWPCGKDRDYDAMIEKFYASPDDAPIPMFIGFPCAKDSTWDTRFPNKSNAVIMTMCKYEWFEKWEKEPQGKRGEEYNNLKKKFEKRILEEGLYKYYPQTRGHVNHTSVGSSLTFNHYLNSHRGEVYGLESHPERFEEDDWLRPETPLKGLFLTGQDVTTLGVTGALMAGILTAHSVMGYGGPSDIVSGRNMVEDLWHLDERNKKAGKDRFCIPVAEEDKGSTKKVK